MITVKDVFRNPKRCVLVKCPFIPGVLKRKYRVS